MYNIAPSYTAPLKSNISQKKSVQYADTKKKSYIALSYEILNRKNNQNYDRKVHSRTA